MPKGDRNLSYDFEYLTKEDMKLIIKTFEDYDGCLEGEWNSGITNKESELLKKIKRIVDQE